MKLHIGCSSDKREGYLNVDINSKCNPDKILDLNKIPYPFSDNSFDEILANHILEHLDDPLAVVMELKRVLKKGGVLKIEVPYYKTEGYFSDLTHKKAFTLKTFPRYFSRDFDIMRNDLVCKGKLRQFLPFKRFLNFFMWNIYDVICVELKK